MNFGLILLADQNPTNLDLLTESFSAFGFELAVVPDSATTLTESQQLQPDLILLSVSLPELDGFETCRRLKEHDKTKDIPVIFITTSTDRTSSVKGFSVGAVDYVTKPFQLEEVIARVTTHLKIRNLQSQLEETITNLEQEMVERQYARKPSTSLCNSLSKSMSECKKTWILLLECNTRYFQTHSPHTAMPLLPGPIAHVLNWEGTR